MRGDRGVHCVGRESRVLDPGLHTLPERYNAGAKLEVDEDEVPVVIAPATAAHLRALADVLLRNGESGAFKAYVEVLPHCTCPG